MAKLILTLVFLLIGVLAAASDEKAANSTSKAKHDFVLSDFNKQFFWQKPPEGMFEVNIGLDGSASGASSAPVDLNG